MLPRPARLVRQNVITGCRKRHFTSTFVVRASSTQGQVVGQAPSPTLDDSFHDLIKEGDMGMGMGPKRSLKSTSKGKGKMTIPDLELVDDSHPSSSKSQHKFGLIVEDLDELDSSKYDEEEVGEFDFSRREERRSPATVLGSKRVGVVVLPDHLKNGIQRQIDQLDNPRTLRQSYLSLPSSSSRRSREEKVDHRSSRPRKTVEGELAKAAGILPGEYGVVRNVFEELERRLGKGWLDRSTTAEKKEIVEYSGGLGSGSWATIDAFLESSTSDNLKIQLVHSSRHSLDLAQKIMEDVSEQAADVHFNRKHVPSDHRPAVVLSTFLLSTLPTQPSQQTHLNQLLSLKSPYIVLIDKSTPTGWQAISRARSYLLDQSNSDDPLHVLAPCPHDGICPLVSTEDKCSFSQRIQRPSFVRKTKHSNRGEEDTGYCYVVIARGERPISNLPDEPTFRGMPKSSLGRLGGVGKEELARSRLKQDGRSVLREIEGHEGILEVVNLPEQEHVNEHDRVELDAEDKQKMQNGLREEAYSWPRLVAPPMKRSGHVTMDACCPDGNIQRLTYSKSHSKQGYHDARKSSWGDIFPHTPKATPVVRTRGVRRLNKTQNDDEVLNELLAASAEERSDNDSATLKELESLGIKLPKAEVIEEADLEGESSSSDSFRKSYQTEGPFSKSGQKRGFSNMTMTPSRHTVQITRSSNPLQTRSMSARPPPRPKVTLSTLRKLSKSDTPITVLTAYDYPTALLSESCGVDMTLVGDSLSQVCLGHDSTTQITLEEIIHHAKAVTRGSKTPFVFADLPFGSFEVSLEEGVRNVIKLIKESGVDGVKIEGGVEIIPLVRKLSEIGIPVMPHLGLQPQRATSLSGYLVQGRTAQSAYEIYQTASEMKDAGAFGLLLEAIPHNVAKKITDDLDIITIGIGAGNGTNGQVLVITDVLGTYSQEDIVGDDAKESTLVETPNQLQQASELTLPTPKKPSASPRFVRQFGSIGMASKYAINQYVQAVKDRSFPDTKESYNMKKDEWDGFLTLLEEAKVNNQSP
ncbi:3-methyl-2-oxobutanoate hydroxymethyltransferase [Kwoniella shivajii]|uniref:3-methyl-2-oxobutanoate hydroxymethyltransferase n=1 Tax=Kwoniella shivajii TaxID=564305 RepID=A0ABZ1CVT5_9TREE|nr:3-methyl-2-oxobutanoate hydroxymethyltransferase [Kwoniella shivajii]